MKKIVSNLLTAIISIVVVLAVLEIVVGIYLNHLEKLVIEKNQANIITYAPINEIFMPASPEGYTNCPNQSVHWWGMDIHTDSLGCRTGARTQNGRTVAADSARVVLFLGDSYVFGIGLRNDATIPAYLERKLNELTQNNWHVVNGGVLGYDFQQYLDRLRRLVPPIKPSLIVVGVCQNDLFPCEDPFGNVMAERGLQQIPAKHSANRTVAILDWLERGQSKILSSSALVTLYRQAIYGIRWKSSRRAIPANVKTASLAAAPKLVNEFIGTVKEIGIPCLFVYFPQYDELGNNDPFIYMRLLKESGQMVLDLSHSSDITVDCYFSKIFRGKVFPEMHYNSKGAEIVAGEIARRLTEEDLLNRRFR